MKNDKLSFVKCMQKQVWLFKMEFTFEIIKLFKKIKKQLRNSSQVSIINHIVQHIWSIIIIMSNKIMTGKSSTIFSRIFSMDHYQFNAHFLFLYFNNSSIFICNYIFFFFLLFIFFLLFNGHLRAHPIV